MGKIGNLLGVAIVIFYAITSLYFIMMTINKRIKKSSSIKSLVQKLLRIFLKVHRYTGIITVLLVFLHFYIQTKYVYFSTTGLIAAIFMFVVAILGLIHLFVFKRKNRLLAKIHRVLGILPVIFIILHLVRK